MAVYTAVPRSNDANAFKTCCSDRYCNRVFVAWGSSSLFSLAGLLRNTGARTYRSWNHSFREPLDKTVNEPLRASNDPTLSIRLSIRWRITYRNAYNLHFAISDSC